MRAAILLAFVGLCLLAVSCSHSNNLLLGRVQARLGSHTVVVTDCYRTSAPPPEQLQNGDYHYMPCRDAEVWIRSEELTVNGTLYGHLAPGDGVLVDHGRVSIERKGRG